MVVSVLGFNCVYVYGEETVMRGFSSLASSRASPVLKNISKQPTNLEIANKNNPLKLRLKQSLQHEQTHHNNHLEAPSGGKADEYVPDESGYGGGGGNPQTGFGGGSGGGGNPQTGFGGGGGQGVTGGDPAEIVAKALLCFNDKYIYSSCEESYRLTASGDLNVPFYYTEQYCDGPCLSETHLVLNCIENILSHFEFYNRATIQDVKDTIKEGCSYGPERGHFSVAEHIQENSAQKTETASNVLLGFGLMIIASGLLRGHVM